MTAKPAMNHSTIVIAFPGWPNETVISTWTDKSASGVILLDGANMTEAQKQALIDAHAGFVEECLASIASRPS